MKAQTILTIFFSTFIVLTFPIFGLAQEATKVKLPAPKINGGKPLMQTLNERKTSREFSPKPISDQTLSNLLWAAFGVNRPDGRRTAPSAKNMQEIDIYVAKSDGVYVYDAYENTLKIVIKEDLRALTGAQPFVKDAPINLIYVADLSKMKGLSSENINLYSAADTGFISENVYLFCASEGLATVIRGSVGRAALSKALGFGPDKKIILAQTVGYPKE